MLVVLMVGFLSLTVDGGEPLFFDTNDTDQPPAGVPAVRPWKIVPLDPNYGGQWVAAADLNADGGVEFVACENHNVGDVHYASTAVAHDLDGAVLWRWGNPEIGRKAWHHDVACQIHDLDGDGWDEIAAGYAMLNADGSIRWTFKSAKVDQNRGHLDCLRLVRRPRSSQVSRNGAREPMSTVPIAQGVFSLASSSAAFGQ